MLIIDFAKPFVLPPYWLNHPQVVKRIDGSSLSTEGVSITQINNDKPSASELLEIPHACPLKIKLSSESDWWQLPIEPVISVECKNKIVKRNVLKAGIADVQRRGSVKELWAQEDYSVNISGVFIASDGEQLPEQQMRKLRKYCEAREAIEVMSPLLTIFKIHKIAIEDYALPFTAGITNQMYSIKAVSDDFDESNLLIAVK